MRLFCVNCNKEINGVLTDGREIYPHRPDLYSKKFWKCPECDNYVGCHGESTRPLGCIPTEEIKKARIKLHSKFDPLWKSGKISRRNLYKRISTEIGRTFHNGDTRSVEECDIIFKLLEKVEKELC